MDHEGNGKGTRHAGASATLWRMAAAPAHILILEDQPSSMDWLIETARSVFPTATQQLAYSCAEGLAACSQPVDLALLDIALPDGSGLDVLLSLQQRQPQAACVMTTIFDDDTHLFRALQLGARGYVLKDQSREQLGTMLRAMLDDQPPLSPAIARRLLAQFQSPPAVATPDDGLTDREREVLQLVSKGYSVPQAAKALEISPNTAHTHIKAVYRKLHVASRAEAVLAARRLGLA